MALVVALAPIAASRRTFTLAANATGAGPVVVSPTPVPAASPMSVTVFVVVVAVPTTAVLEVRVVVVVAPASPVLVITAPAMKSLPVTTVPVPVWESGRGSTEGVGACDPSRTPRCHFGRRRFAGEMAPSSSIVATV